MNQPAHIHSGFSISQKYSSIHILNIIILCTCYTCYYHVIKDYVYANTQCVSYQTHILRYLILLFKTVE